MALVVQQMADGDCRLVIGKTSYRGGPFVARPAVCEGCATNSPAATSTFHLSRHNSSICTPDTRREACTTPIAQRHPPSFTFKITDEALPSFSHVPPKSTKHQILTSCVLSRDQETQPPMRCDCDAMDITCKKSSMNTCMSVALRIGENALLAAIVEISHAHSPSPND